MIDAAVKALSQILSPPMRTILWRSIGLALVLITVLAIGLQRTRGGLDPIRHPAQRNLTQRQQVLGAEKALDGMGGLIGQIDLARLEPRLQIIRGQINQLDVIGLIEDPVSDVFDVS